MKAYIVKNGGVKGHPDYQEGVDCIFPFECDVLVPAALEQAINITNADNVKAKLIAEGSNGGTTVEADHIL